MPLPNSPAVALATFRAQLLTLDPAANPGGAVTTHGLRVRIGNR